MGRDKIKQILRYAIPFLAFIVIFRFALACGGSEPSKEKLSIPKEKGVSKELNTGQEFIYNGVKIALTKYELLGTNIDKNLLWVYLYVENIDDVPHEHIYGEEFVIYHKGREAVSLCSGFTGEEGKKEYATSSYRELYPGEVCEG